MDIPILRKSGSILTINGETIALIIRFLCLIFTVVALSIILSGGKI